MCRLPWPLLLVLSLVLPIRDLAWADAGDTTNLHLDARWGRGPCYASDAAADLLLVGEGSVLEIYGNPAEGEPNLRGEILLNGVVMDVCRSGSMAYVAAARGGLRIVNLSSVEHPVEAGALRLSGTAYGVDVVGERVYVAMEDGGLRVVDVTVPDLPIELGFYDTDLYAMDVQVVGTTAYVADMYDSALKIYDVTDPGSIQLLGQGSTPGPPWAVDVNGARAVLVDDYAGIVAFDVSNPAAPSELGSAWLNDVGYDIETIGDLALVANDWQGLVMVDLQNLPAMSTTSILDTDGAAFGVCHFGNTAYLSDSEGGLCVVDISDPLGISEIWQVGGAGQLRSVRTLGTLSYAVDEDYGLRILQPTTDGGAVQLGFVSMPGSPVDVDVSEGFAYVAVGNSGDVRIANVSNPRQPSNVNWIDLPEYSQGSGARAVSVEGGRLAVVDKYYGIYLYDVSDPTSPVLNGWHGTYSYPRDVILRGDYAYVADRDGSIRVIDVSGAPALSEVGSVSSPGYNFAIELDGALLFVAKDWRGIWVVDVTDPASPEGLLTIDTVGSAADMSAVWPYLYVAEGSHLRVYDYSNIMNVTQVGDYHCDDATLAVSASGRTVQMAGLAGGWAQLSNDLLPVGIGDSAAPTPALQLEANVPNPFNPRTSIRFALASESATRLEVLDAAGRRIRVLVDEVLQAGPHECIWDGRDDSGRAVSSGVYRYRLESKGRSQTRGMVLIR